MYKKTNPTGFGKPVGLWHKLYYNIYEHKIPNIPHFLLSYYISINFYIYIVCILLMRYICIHKITNNDQDYFTRWVN